MGKTKRDEESIMWQKQDISHPGQGCRWPGWSSSLDERDLVGRSRWEGGGSQLCLQDHRKVLRKGTRTLSFPLCPQRRDYGTGFCYYPGHVMCSDSVHVLGPRPAWYSEYPWGMNSLRVICMRYMKNGKEQASPPDILNLVILIIHHLILHLWQQDGGSLVVSRCSDRL